MGAAGLCKGDVGFSQFLYKVMQYTETEKSGETRGPLMKVTDLEIQQLDHVSRGSSTSPLWYL